MSILKSSKYCNRITAASRFSRHKEDTHTVSHNMDNVMMITMMMMMMMDTDMSQMPSGSGELDPDWLDPRWVDPNWLAFLSVFSPVLGEVFFQTGVFLSTA